MFTSLDLRPNCHLSDACRGLQVYGATRDVKYFRVFKAESIFYIIFSKRVDFIALLWYFTVRVYHFEKVDIKSKEDLLVHPVPHFSQVTDACSNVICVFETSVTSDSSIGESRAWLLITSKQGSELHILLLLASPPKSRLVFIKVLQTASLLRAISYFLFRCIFTLFYRFLEARQC